MALRKRGESATGAGTMDDAFLDPQERRDLHKEVDRVKHVQVTEPGYTWGVRTFRSVWGEEKITPVPGSYSTVTVGPFEVLYVVPEGADAELAFRAANSELAAMAEIERERKVQSFINKLHQSIDRAKGGRS